ncbi:hypothetical protein [Aestuariivirga sp.]|uniref:hypothetical protein n=1 Tax=Aestuariivirga sp. TaxID=2650926 RepID=UPI0039E47012
MKKKPESHPERVERLAKSATDRYLRLRASVALECAIGSYIHAHGVKDTVQRLLDEADHLTEFM